MADSIEDKKKRITSLVEAKDAPDNELKEYIKDNSLNALASLSFTLDEKGNAIANAKPLVQAVIADVLDIKVVRGESDKDFQERGVAALGGGVRGGASFDYVKQEATRMVNERFLPQIVGVTPLNSLPALTLEKFKETAGEQGNLEVTLKAYEIREHEQYLANPLIKNNPLSQPDVDKMVIDKSQVQKLKAFGLTVEPAAARKTVAQYRGIAVNEAEALSAAPSTFRAPLPPSSSRTIVS